MKSLNIKVIISNALYKKFKPTEGNYLCFIYNKEVICWYVRNVYMKGNRAKISLSKFQNGEYVDSRTCLIESLRDDWFVWTKSEFNKNMILANLKEEE